MSHEIKVGILAFVSIVIVIWGFNFIKGKNLLTSTTTLYSEYKDIDGLPDSAPIYLSGMQIGVVADRYFNPDNSGKIIIVMEFENKIQIPKNTIARIISSSLMGGKAIDLYFINACTSTDCAQDGDYIDGQLFGLVESMAGDYLSDAKGFISKVDSTFKSMTKGGKEGAGESLKDIKTIIENLKSTTHNLNRLIAKSSGNIEGILRNFESVSKNLAASNQKITEVLNNTNAFTQKLNRLDLESTVSKTNETMSSTKATIDQLKGTLAKADGAIANFNDILSKVNNKEGSLGLLVNDKELYENLSKTSQNLDLLLQDFRLNPARYTRILRRKRAEYKVPEKDPAFDK